MPIFVDTNIFVRYFTKDDPKKAEQVMKLFGNAAEGKISLITNLWVFAELEFIFRRQYKLEKARIITLLKSIFTVDNLQLYNQEWIEASLEIFEQENIDFVDCMIAAFLKINNFSSIYSYDPHFDRVAWLERREP